MTTDNLGITELEDKQISALSEGAAPEDVASLSKQPIDQIPKEIPADVVDQSYYGSEEDEQSIGGVVEEESLYEITPPQATPEEAASAAMMASLASDTDADRVISNYSGMYDQFMDSGTSPIYNSIRNTVASVNEADLKGSIGRAAMEGNVELTQALIEHTPTLLRKESAMRVAGLQNASTQYEDASVGVDQREISRIFLEAISDSVTSSGETSAEVFHRMVNSEIAANDGTLMAGLGLVESFFLGEQALGLAGVGTDIFGERYNILQGSLIRDLAQKIKDTPAEDVEEVVGEILDSIAKNAGVLYKHENDFVKTFFLESLKEYYDTPSGDKPVDRWMANALGVFDMPGLATIVTSAKVGRALIKSKLAASKAKSVKPGLVVANPNLDAVLDAAALTNPSMATKLGTTPAEVAARALPGNKVGDDFNLEGASPELLNMLEGTKTQAQKVQDRIDNTFIYRSADYEEKQKELYKILTLSDEVTKVKESASTISRDPFNIDPNTNSINIGAMYGDSSSTPLTYRKAITLATKLNEATKLEDGFDSKSLTLMVRDDTTGTYQKFDKNVHSKDGLFYVRVDARYDMVPNDALGHIPLSEGATKPVGSITGNWIGTFLRAPEQWLDRTLYAGTNVALDLKGITAHELESLARPFTKLSWGSKKKVSDVLLDGDANQKVFSVTELSRDKGLTDKEIHGYLAARYIEDVAYNEKNLVERKRLIREGYKGVYVKSSVGSTFQTAAKAVDPSNVDFKSVKQILDPATGIAESIDLRKALKMQEKGYVIAKALKEVDIDGALYSYILVKGEDMGQLPSRVLAHRQGHITRINKEPYYIDEIVKRKVDGVITDKVRTIHVAKSFKEAKDAVAELKANPKTRGASYSHRLDRNIDNGDTILKSETDTLIGSNHNYWFSGRGDPLTTMAGEIGAIENPIASINKSIATLASTKAYNELIQASLVRHQKTYGDLVDINNQPLWVNDPHMGSYFDVSRADAIGNPEVAAALAEYRAIEDLKFHPAAMDRLWVKLLKGVNESFLLSKNETVSRGATAATKTLAKYPLGSTARSITFSMTIPLRFTRHLLLQPVTATHLFGLDPKLTALAYRDALAIGLSLMAHNSPWMLSNIRKSARAVGMSGDDFDRLTESFRKSGKAYSIDSHTAVGEINFSWSKDMADTRLGNVAQGVASALKSPVVIGKNIGFNVGEFVNQASTYSFAYRKWEEANPGKIFDKRAADEVTSISRSLSINMTSTSQFKYQKNFLAPATQFIAISHKMALNLLGQNPDIARVNGKFSSLLHARYVAGNLAMFGAGGIGLQSVYDRWIKESGVEVNPVLENALHGGFWGALINTSLDMAFGRELGTNRLDVAGSISPSSGVLTFGKNFVENLWYLNVAEAFGGPSGKVLPNFYSAYKEAREMWAIEDDYNTPEKIIEAFQIAASQFGIFSDIHRYNMAMAYNDRMQKLFTVDKDGRPTAIANTWEEIMMKATFGIQTRAESELYNTAIPDYRDINTRNKKDKSDYDKDLDALVKYMYKTFREDPDPLTRVEKQKAITFALHGANPRSMQLLGDAQKRFAGDPYFERFSADLIERHGLFDPNKDMDKARNAVRASDATEEEDKESLLDLINALEDSLNLSREQYKENF